ncbi:MAG: hypothetical protein ACFFD4_11480 [Candidatus Odinarchaeota archaeon]
MLFFAYSIIEWIWVTVSVIMLLPLVVMIRNYKHSSLKDYLLMALVFLSVSVSSFLLPLTNHVSDLLLSKLLLVTFYSQYFFLIIVVYRMKWEKIPVIFTLVNSCYFLFLTALTFFRQELTVRGISVKQDHLTVMVGLYSLFGASLIFYIAFTAKPVTRTKRVSRCVNGWKAVGFLLILGGIINLLNWYAWPLLSLTKDLFSLIALACVVIIVWMAVWYPEALLFSQAQSMRTVDLYKIAQQNDTEQIAVSIRVLSLVNYLEKIIPPRVRGIGTLFTFNEEQELLIKRVSNKGVAIAIIILLASLIDVLLLFTGDMNFSLTASKIYALQDLLVIVAGIAFLLPLRNFRNTVRPGKDIDGMIQEMSQGLGKMVTGLKIMITCFILTIVLGITEILL